MAVGGNSSNKGYCGYGDNFNLLGLHGVNNLSLSSSSSSSPRDGDTEPFPFMSFPSNSDTIAQLRARVQNGGWGGLCACVKKVECCGELGVGNEEDEDDKMKQNSKEGNMINGRSMGRRYTIELGALGIA